MMLKRWSIRIVLGGIALLIARAPTIRPVFEANEMATAKEMLVYRLSAAQPLIFRVPAGQRRLRILTNADLPSGGPVPALTYNVRVRLDADQVDQVFPLIGQARLKADGNPAVFALGGAQPAWTKEIALERASERETTLELSLAEPGTAAISVRVLGSAHRAPLAAELKEQQAQAADRARLAELRGPIAFDDLPREVQSALFQDHWARLPAAPKSPRGRLYLTGTPALPSRPERPLGSELQADRALAYLLQGPGTIRIAPADTAVLRAELRWLYADGSEEQEVLRLEPGERLDRALRAGLVTLRIQGQAEGRVLVIGESPSLVADEGARTERADGGWELEPSWRTERVALAEPGTLPVSYRLVGRPAEELRVVARAARPTDAPLRLEWSLLGGRGEVLRQGAIAGSAPRAAEDRLDADPPSEPLSGFLWPDARAAVLEVRASTTAAVSLYSRAFEPPIAGRGGNDPTRIRGQRRERPAWVSIRATNMDQLERVGRAATLRTAERLERRVTPPVSTESNAAVEPALAPPRTLFVVPAGPRQTTEANLIWPVLLGRPMILDPTPVASPGAPTLTYLGDAASARGELTVKVDGGPPQSYPLYTARGQVSLPSLSPGPHQLELEAPRSARLFLDQPIRGATPSRLVGAYRMDSGTPAELTVNKSRDREALGIVVYAERSVLGQLRLEVLVDRGRRVGPRTGQSRGRTTLRSEVTPRILAGAEAEPLTQQSGAIAASEPIFVALKDDLDPGGHRVSVRVRGTEAPVWMRFFAPKRTDEAERIIGFGKGRGTR